MQSRSHPIRASEKSLGKNDHSERLQGEAPSKNIDNTNNDVHQQRRNESSNHNSAHSRQSSSDRLADGEERLGSSRGQQWVPPYRHPPSRTSPNNHTVSQVSEFNLISRSSCVILIKLKENIFLKTLGDRWPMGRRPLCEL